MLATVHKCSPGHFNCYFGLSICHWIPHGCWSESKASSLLLRDDKFLQKETGDLAEACFGKQAVCDTLIGKLTDAFATELYDRTKALGEIHNIPEADAARKHKQRKMGDFVVETSLGLGTELSCSQTMKTELLLPCLGGMVCELDQRFPTLDAGLLKGMQACRTQLKKLPRNIMLN
jgi:hypothetical protein